MSRHEAVNTHTFTTEEGIKIVAELADYRLRSLHIQFPGSGNRPIALIPSEVRELAAITQDASSFLIKQGIMPERDLEEPQLG